MCDNPNCIHVIPPKHMSEPCSRYFHYHAELCGFIAFVVFLAMRQDEFAKKAAEHFKKVTSEDEKENARFEELIELGTGVLMELHSYLQLIFQTMICRAVDNFLIYIADILALVFTTRPETLRSNEKVKLDELLQHSTMEDLIKSLAERKIEKLSYQGMREISSHLHERLGFSLFATEEDMRRAVLLIEVRNLIVHNRGMVNKIFKSRVPWHSAVLGDQIRLDFREDSPEENVFAHVRFLAESVNDVDQRVSEKFRLPLPISRKEFMHTHSNYS